jgi:DNA-binding NarL/FixJ family response regulator
MPKSPVHIHSNHSLPAQWLSNELNKLGWETQIKRSGISRDAIAVIDISSDKDVELVIEAEQRQVPIVIFSRLPEKKLLSVLFEFEIAGFIHMASDLKAIESTMNAAENGDEYFDEKILSLILSGKYQTTYERLASLSNRELEIIDGIMEDLTNDEIAKKFNLSVRTVNAHKRNILQKLEERSLVGVARAMLNYTLRYT